MEIQVEELAHVLEILPKTLSPSLPLSPRSPSFNAKQHGCRIEPVQDTFVHLGWLAQKARRKPGVRTRLSPALPRLTGPLEGRFSLVGKPGDSGQPALGEQRAKRFLEIHPISLPLSLGTHQGMPSSSRLTVLKLPFMGVLNFYLIKEQMLYKRRSVGD